MRWVSGQRNEHWDDGAVWLVSNARPTQQQMAGWCPVNSNKTQQTLQRADKNSSGASWGRKWASQTVCAPDAPCCTLTQLCTDTLTDTIQVSLFFFQTSRLFSGRTLINLLSQIFPFIGVQCLQDSIAGKESFSFSSCQGGKLHLGLHGALKLSSVKAWSKSVYLCKIFGYTTFLYKKLCLHWKLY